MNSKTLVRLVGLGGAKELLNGRRTATHDLISHDHNIIWWYFVASPLTSL